MTMPEQKWNVVWDCQDSWTSFSYFTSNVNLRSVFGENSGDFYSNKILFTNRVVLEI